jgi:hypothetical protein
MKKLEDKSLSHGPEFTKHYVRIMKGHYGWKHIVKEGEKTYWNLVRGGEIIKMTEALKVYGYQLEAA